ncbi:MAG: peptidoglycan-associated lipoprotein Pal [Acidobacteria bacterium]|nr:peptidoglycan-associated lipoprotein Pal [Acidobacteriota bacterium]
MKKNSLRITLLALLIVILLAGCKKKPVAVAPQTPPPPPPTPSAQLSVNPATIMQGDSATLAWSSENAVSVTIDPIGKVDLSGQQAVSPNESTTYHLTATGPGGTAEQTARLTVNAKPAPPPAVTTAPPESLADSFRNNVQDKGDIYFDYDSFSIRPDQQAALQRDAQWFKQHPDAKVSIEGHCDERGSTEYNLTLGDNRARAVKDALVQLGVPAPQLNTISYGKEKPFCTESTESCWQQNRRDHFTLGGGMQ